MPVLSTHTVSVWISTVDYDASGLSKLKQSCKCACDGGFPSASVPRTGPGNATISHLGKYKVVARVTAAVAEQRTQIM